VNMKELLQTLKRTMARAVGAEREPEPRASRRILFVCMGNICRSPTAEGVFRKLLAERAPELDVEIDSAGTHGYHDGAPPDPRACRAAERRGVDLKPLRARRVTERDFERFELVLAMDEQNREFLLEVCPAEYRHRVRLLLEFAPHLERREVPDPYYGGSTGFEHVLDLVEEAATGLLAHLRSTPPPVPPGGTAEAARDR
jgi:low molecular weight protein-tyrosine phosphatase